jgi:hypothetical protein
MSLGFADPTKPENGLRTERQPVSAFTTFHEEAPTAGGPPPPGEAVTAAR